MRSSLSLEFLFKNFTTNFHILLSEKECNAEVKQNCLRRTEREIYNVIPENLITFHRFLHPSFVYFPFEALTMSQDGNKKIRFPFLCCSILSEKLD